MSEFCIRCDRPRYKRALCRPCYRKEPDVRAHEREYARRRKQGLDPNKPRCARGCDRAVYVRNLCSPCYKKEPDQRAVTRAHARKRYKERPEVRAYLIAEAKTYYAQNAERVKARYRVYREQNHARVLEREREYAAKNPTRAKDWRSVNREVVLSYAKAYSRANRKRRSLWQSIREARKRAGGSFTIGEWETLCKRYGYRCLACGKRRKLTIDHIVPLSLDGPNTIENVQPLCGPCNGRKGARIILYLKNSAKPED